jgi:hypothetical protein
VPLIALIGCVPPFDAPRPIGDGDDTADPAGPTAVEDAASSVWIGEAGGDWAGDVLQGLGALGGPAPDVLVGAKGARDGGGTVYLLRDVEAHAVPQLLAAAAVRFTTDDACAALGTSLGAWAGADGRHGGVVMGAHNAYGGCSPGDGVGTVWVVTGGVGVGPRTLVLDAALAAGDPGVTEIVGPGTGARAGAAVAIAGDIDEDEHPDLLVGGVPSDLADPGAAWLLLGPFGAGQRSILLDADATLAGRAPGDQAGCAVAGLGDFDGTGTPWLGVGACGGDLGGPDAGEVYLFEAALPLPPVLGTEDQRIVAGSTGDHVGMGLVAGGDLDGDGRDDAVVHADSCGQDVHLAPGVGCRDGTWGRASWAVLRAPDLQAGVLELVEDRAALWIGVPTLANHFACDGVVSGRFLGDPDALDLAIGTCTDDALQGEVHVLVDVVPAGQRLVLPDDADHVVLRGLAGSQAGAELGAVGDTLLVGAWKADPETGSDAGAVYVVPGW